MNELEFRDGARKVPDHIRDLLIGVDTYQMTYSQAINFVNNKLVGDRLGEAQSDLIREHFRMNPWE